MKKHSLLGLSIAITCFAFITGCKKDDPTPPSDSGFTVNPGDGLYVCDEGNFQGGNAKVSFYRYGDQFTQEDMFRPVNGRPLGDVCQSMTMINGSLYVVVNNSGKIEIVDPHTFRSRAVINGFVSPRYIQQVTSAKAYVTDLFANSVYVVNLNTNAITGSIAIPGMTEAMVQIGSYVYVTSPDRDKLYKIDANTDMLSDSVTVSKGGNSLQVDANGKLWYLSYGDYFTSVAGSLARINPVSMTVEQDLPFTTSQSPTRLAINSTGDTLYYIDYNIMRFPITSTSLPGSPFISAGSAMFYSVNVNPANNDVYVTDAVDFSQRGKLMRFDRNGSLLDTKTVGVNPGTIFFY